MNPSLEEIYSWPDDNPIKQALIANGIFSQYDLFCDGLENTLLSAIDHLEKLKSHYVKLGEDAISLMLIYALSVKGFNATHDAYRNGHCDIVVRQGLYEWYGEAKLDDGPSYVMKGFRQLCDRYSPGGATTNRGGLLVYTRKRNKLRVLDVWLKRIVQDYERPVTSYPICMLTLTGKTEHEHAATGLQFKVRHFPVSMFHQPTD
jgi:hypothetical protein